MPQDEAKCPIIKTFWNTCIRKEEYLPTEKCPEGTPEKTENKILVAPKCPWWINSPRHNYCFWKYIHENSDNHGNISKVAQAEISKLIGCSSAKTYILFKEAMEALLESLKNKGLIGDLDDIDDFFDSNSSSFGEGFDDTETY